MAVRDPVRIACCQLEMRAEGWDALAARLDDFAAEAAASGADFILFPELFTLALAGAGERELSAAEAVALSSEHTDRLRGTLADIAVRHRVNVIGGSHLDNTGGAVRNLCFVALRDGTVHVQAKLHPTPDEAAVWGVEGGDTLAVIATDCGPIGVLVCYDVEFPELARRLADQGAQILFVPFWTDARAGYMRVRLCAAARAVENQCYVALAGDVGTPGNVFNVDDQYAQSCVLTPCDSRFPADGIAAEAETNVEALIVAELDTAALDWARREGAVRNLADRRGDLYQVRWSEDF